MPVPASRHAAELQEAIRSILAATDEVRVADPSVETFEGIVATGGDLEDCPRIRLVVSESTLKAATDRFLAASRTADLVDRGVLELRTDGGSDRPHFVTDETVAVVVTAGDHATPLSTADPAFVDAAREAHDERFEAAEPVDLRTPPLSLVRETLADELGDAVLEDFDAAVDRVETADPDEPVDEVTLALLVAAKNDVLLYDVSQWGERTGVGSKATFSRAKTRLEERGLIDTEKVPIDVGRPRLRLKLGDEMPPGAAMDATVLVDAAY